MNNLPLQPLVWGVDEYTGEPVSNSLLHGYIVMNDGNGKFKVAYYLLSGGTYTKFATGFATIDEAKAWAWNHYNEKMQPYVKPMPTWIDASERLPEDDGKYLVATSCGKQWMGNYNLPPKPNEWMLNGWSMNGGWHPFDITHWMPIPEFSTMQNNKGE